MNVYTWRVSFAERRLAKRPVTIETYYNLKWVKKGGQTGIFIKILNSQDKTVGTLRLSLLKIFEMYLFSLYYVKLKKNQGKNITLCIYFVEVFSWRVDMNPLG